MKGIIRVPGLTSRLIMLFQMFQLGVFSYFSSVTIPHNASDFLTRVFQDTIKHSDFLAEIFTYYCYQDKGYLTGLQIKPPQKFEEEGLSFISVFNCSIPFLAHLGLIIYFLLLKLLSCIRRPPESLFERFRKMEIERLKFNGFITMYLLFDVQLLVYAALNIYIPQKQHIIFIGSLSVSYIYFALSGLIVLAIMLLTWKSTIQALRSQDSKQVKQYGLLFEKYIPTEAGSKGNQRHFQVVPLSRNVCFAIFIVFMQDFPITQGFWICGINASVLGMIFWAKPHGNKVDFAIDLTSEALLTSYNICYLILGLNDEFEYLKNTTRFIIGWTIIGLFMINIMINGLAIIIPSLFDLFSYIFRNDIEKLRRKKNISLSKSSQLPKDQYLIEMEIAERIAREGFSEKIKSLSSTPRNIRISKANLDMQAQKPPLDNLSQDSKEIYNIPATTLKELNSGTSSNNNGNKSPKDDCKRILKS